MKAILPRTGGAIAFALFSAALAQASPITTPSSFPEPPAIIDFNEFSTKTSIFGAPVQIGQAVGRDIVAISNNVNSFIGTVPNYNLGNGAWTAAKTPYVAADSTTGVVQFIFRDAAVFGIGGFINLDFAATLRIRDQQGNLLESTTLNPVSPFAQGGQNGGGFRGFLRPQADIWSFEMTGGYIVLDDLQLYGPSQQQVTGPETPEPVLWVLVGSGLVGMAVVQRRKKAEK